MKKRFLFCLMAGLACGGFFTSCSDDDSPATDEVVVCPVSTTTYTDNSGLVLTYSGEPMLGKKVVFTPDANDGSKATLTLSGVLDPSILAGFMSREDASSTVAAPGVIPGQLTTTFDVDLTISGDEVSFKGTTEQSGCTIAYEGNATGSNLTLNLNVTMPENDLANTTWTVVPFDNVTYESLPIHFVWESSKEISIMEGYSLPVGTIVELALRMPLIGDQSVNGALTQVFHSVTFGTDGNITAEYKKNMTDTEWAESPLNMAQYTAGGGNLLLYLNPSQIIANVQNSRLSRATSSEIIANLISGVLPMLSQGVPVKYTLDGSNLKVYLGADLLLPLMQAVTPIFQDEAFVQQIMDMVANNPSLGMMSSMVGPVLQQLPEVIAGTTNIEVGVNFQK